MILGKASDSVDLCLKFPFLTKESHINGILLAGGKSRRMGMDKGKLLIHGKPLYHRPLGILRDHCKEILISTCSTEGSYGNYTHLCDSVPGAGPMGGILTCLEYSGAEWNLVLSYDMPFVSGELISLLLDRREGADIVVPAREGRPPEPLCALYRKSVSGVMRQMIREENYAVHALFPRVRTRLEHIQPGDKSFPPHLFMNVNSPEDLEQTLAILDEE
jgi:molybdopterin-guanine dinucleotide biosynthesis protein A